jgi:hypothetical protein
MSLMLCITGVDAPEAALGLDVTDMFQKLGLARNRQVAFHAVQDNKNVPDDWLSKRKINKAYQEADRVVAKHNPRVVVDLHHACVPWKCFEVQVFSGLCAESSAFQAWATSLTDVLVRAGGSDDYDKAIFCYQLPSVRDRLWFDMEYIQVEVIPSLAPVRERMKIPEAPLTRFEFPGAATYQREIESLAHVLAGIYDHHPWLTTDELRREP